MLDKPVFTDLEYMCDVHIVVVIVCIFCVYRFKCSFHIQLGPVISRSAHQSVLDVQYVLCGLEGDGVHWVVLWCAYDVMTLEKEGKGNIKPDYMAGAALKTLASALYAIRSNGMVWVRLPSCVEMRSNCRRWWRPSSMLKKDPVHLLPAACVASQQ